MIWTVVNEWEQKDVDDDYYDANLFVARLVNPEIFAATPNDDSIWWTSNGEREGKPVKWRAILIGLTKLQIDTEECMEHPLMMTSTRIRMTMMNLCPLLTFLHPSIKVAPLRLHASHSLTGGGMHFWWPQYFERFRYFCPIYRACRDAIVLVNRMRLSLSNCRRW